ncbi:hypothetical protein Tsubulata_022717 [Turnera subulata]|uniref:Cupin type-1 domain-containing protein n=1 Tax=Turnera subulata TaxID=218843 RepID=A0A9Q0IZ02_9ROSI|nr:hypothetical protein Tsubulata_022717 [Turnera subulata]
MDFDLSPKFADQELFNGEGGSYQSWSATDFPLLGEAKVGAGRLVLQPQGFALPHFADCSKMGYVLQGTEGIVGMVLPNSSKEVVLKLRKGDVIPVPLGSVSWWYNNGDSELIVVFLGETSGAYVPGQFTYFLLSGGLGILSGFSSEFTSRAYKLNQEDANKLANSQKGVLIVKLDEAAAKAMPQPSCHHQKLVYNIDDASSADDLNFKGGGTFKTLTADKFRFLEEVGLSMNHAKLEAKAMYSPTYTADATIRVQIVGINGKRVLDATVEAGQLLVVPRQFTVAKIAGSEGMEFVSILTSTRPVVEELATKKSVWSALSPIVSQFAQELFHGEGGSYHSWTATEFPLLGEEKVGAGRLVLQPQGFALPHYPDCLKIGHVLQGTEGIVGMVLPNSSKEVVLKLRKGDVIPVPLGSLSWWYNNGDSELTVVFLGETSEAYVPGQFTYFILTGGLGILSGFSSEFTSRAYKLNQEDANKLANSQKGLMIVKLEEAAAKAMPQPRCDHHKLVYNTDDASSADDVNVKGGGTFKTCTADKFRFLEEVGLSVNLANLEAKAMYSPTHTVDGTVRVFYVYEGSGKVQVVGINGKRVLDATVEAGQSLVVPQNFAVAIIAGSEGMESVSILTSTRYFHSSDTCCRPVVEELATKKSVWSALSPIVSQVSLDVTSEFEALFRFADEEAFSGEGGTIHTRSTTAFPLLRETNVGAGMLVLKPQCFIIPHNAGNTKIGYVQKEEWDWCSLTHQKRRYLTSGKEMGDIQVLFSWSNQLLPFKWTPSHLAWILHRIHFQSLQTQPRRRKQTCQQPKGDVIPVPLGSLSWWYNNGDSELTVVFLGETSEAYVPGQFTYFILTGGLGILSGFSSEFTSRAYKLNQEDANKLSKSQKGLMIVKLEEAAAKAMPQPSCHHKLVYNLDNACSPDDVNVKGGGTFKTLTADKFPFLEEVRLSVNHAKLEAKAMPVVEELATKKSVWSALSPIVSQVSLDVTPEFEALFRFADEEAFSGEGGTYHTWSTTAFPLLGEANVGAGMLVLKPQCFILPHNAGNTKIGYAVFNLRKGDVVLVPFGTVSWWYNNGDSDLIMLFVGETSKSYAPGQISYFLLTGLQGILPGFSAEFTSRAYKLSQEDANKLANSQKGTLIVPLDEATAKAMPKPDHKTPHRGGGTLKTLTGDKIPLLEEVGLSLNHGRLEAKAMFSPTYTGDSTVRAFYVYKGSGKVQVVGINGKQVLDATIEAGQLLVVPRQFTVAKIAGSEGLEFFSMLTSTRPDLEELATKKSVWSALSPIVSQVSLKLREVQRKEGLKKLKTNMDFDLSPKFAQEVFNGEGGSYHSWSATEFPLLGEAKVGAGRLVLQPQGFALPHSADCSKIGYALQGSEGIVGMVLPNSSKEVVLKLRKGDVIPVPLGSVSWWYNNGDSELIVASGAYVPGQFTYFLLSGGLGILSGFSSEFTSRAYKLNQEDANKLANSQKGVLIVKLDEAAAKGMPQPSGGHHKLVYNTDDASADLNVKGGGMFKTLTADEFPLLEEVGLSLNHARLEAKAMYSPTYTVDGTVRVFYVYKGSGKVQVVGINGKRVLDATVEAGQLLVVPPHFAVAKIAGSEGLEFVSILTSTRSTIETTSLLITGK